MRTSDGSALWAEGVIIDTQIQDDSLVCGVGGSEFKCRRATFQVRN